MKIIIVNQPFTAFYFCSKLNKSDLTWLFSVKYFWGTVFQKYSGYCILLYTTPVFLPWTTMLAGVLVVSFLVRVCIIWHVYDENWSLDSRLCTNSSPVCIAWYLPSEMIAKNKHCRVMKMSQKLIEMMDK